MKIDQQKLFFIIAPDRSGTTLLQAIMNTFSGFCNTIESRMFGRDSLSCWVPVMQTQDFSYLEKFIEDNWTAEFFVEKSPPSIMCLPEIYKKFPDANFIFLERHPEKILLSQMNLFREVSENGKRKDDLGDIMLEEDNAILNHEFIMARRLYRMILNQVEFKHLFNKKITIRYENIINSLDSQISLLEKTFGIQGNLKNAQVCLSKPSISASFRYGLRGISDKQAIAMINLANQLWNYD